MPKIKNYQKEKIWKLADENVPAFDSAKYDLVFRRLLAERGVSSEKEAEDYLYPSYEHLADPYELDGMAEAIEVIASAIDRSEKIAIYGDYDVDGVTATAVLADFFRKIRVETIQYIPSRQDEGYGLNKEAIQSLVDSGIKLIITVDCGSTSIDEIFFAKSLGLKVVVTDHHSLKMENGAIVLPEADAVVNPKRGKVDTSYYELAGVGVAFYLVRALQIKFVEKYPVGQEKWLLDLVALGTVCDVVPLAKDNRILTKFGLVVLAKTTRVGLKKLAEISGVELKTVESYHLGFLLGPRLNAAGRLEHAKASLSILLTEDEQEAKDLAYELNELNLARQELTEQIVNEAREIIKNANKEQKIFLLKNTQWPAGVVGIVASRLVEEFGKPMLVMEDMGTELKGSARSIAGFNIVEALSECGEFMTHFGGHAYAAGFRLDHDKFVLLNDKLIEISNNKISEKDLLAEINIDLELSGGDISAEFISSLELFQPFGRGNTKPLFLINEAEITDVRLVGKPPTHLKFQISKDDVTISGIAFNYGEELNITKGDRYDLVVTLEINEWNNQKKPDLRLIDMREKK